MAVENRRRDKHLPDYKLKEKKIRYALRIGKWAHFLFFGSPVQGANAHFTQENSLFSFPKYFFNRLRDMGI